MPSQFSNVELGAYFFLIILDLILMSTYIVILFLLYRRFKKYSFTLLLCITLALACLFRASNMLCSFDIFSKNDNPHPEAYFTCMALSVTAHLFFLSAYFIMAAYWAAYSSMLSKIATSKYRSKIANEMFVAPKSKYLASLILFTDIFHVLFVFMTAIYPNPIIGGILTLVLLLLYVAFGFFMVYYGLKIQQSDVTTSQILNNKQTKMFRISIYCALCAIVDGIYITIFVFSYHTIQTIPPFLTNVIIFSLFETIPAILILFVVMPSKRGRTLMIGSSTSSSNKMGTISSYSVEGKSSVIDAKPFLASEISDDEVESDSIQHEPSSDEDDLQPARDSLNWSRWLFPPIEQSELEEAIQYID